MTTTDPTETIDAEHELLVLDHTGDSRISWNRANPDEVNAAEKHFNRLKKAGYLAYRVRGDDKGEVLREFDPGAERIIMSPPMAGG